MYLSLGACLSPSLSRVVLPNGGVLSAEVMDTPEKRAAGMQFRNGFPPNTVMLFVPGLPNFHMHNVSMPLDVIHLDRYGRIAAIQTAKPGSGSQRSNGVSSSAIEAPVGWASANNLKIGDRIRLG